MDNAEGDNFGVGNANDFGLDESYDTIKAESKPVTDDDKLKAGQNKPKKDTAKQTPKIGDMNNTEEKKEKKGIFNKVFGKKDKEEKKQENDY
jgi:penicillin-binding protein 1A